MCCGENDRTAAPRQAPHRDRELSAQQTEGRPELSLCHIYLIYLLVDFCEWGMVQYKRYNNVTPVPADGKMTSGWYYLNSNVTVNGRVNLTGDTNLILGDGYTLTVDGLYIPAGKTLTIYGQTGTGTINSDPSSGAAIGGVSGQDSGNIVIHSGTVIANGGGDCAGIGGVNQKIAATSPSTAAPSPPRAARTALPSAAARTAPWGRLRSTAAR